MICPLLSIASERLEKCSTDCVMYVNLKDGSENEKECMLITNMKTLNSIESRLWSIGRSIDALRDAILIK